MLCSITEEGKTVTGKMCAVHWHVNEVEMTDNVQPMPHRTYHTEVSNKERNVKTHDGNDARQVIQSKTYEDTSGRGLLPSFSCSTLVFASITSSGTADTTMELEGVSGHEHEHDETSDGQSQLTAGRRIRWLLKNVSEVGERRSLCV